METKHINEILEEQVNRIFQSVQDEANKIFGNTIESKIQNITQYEKLKLLSEEQLRLNKIEKESDYPFYIYNHSNKQLLLNQFASRAFLLNVDESNILFDCIIIGRLKLLTNTKFDTSLRDLPAYTFDEFVSGKENSIFFDLGIYYHLNDHEYQKIRLWQEETLIKIVEYEWKCLIGKIQDQLVLSAEPVIFIENEIEQFSSMPDPDIDAIRSWLSGFSFFKGVTFKELDDVALLNGFKAYRQDRFLYKYLVPAKLNPLIRKARSRSTIFVANEYTLFYTLYKIRQWLIFVLNNSTWNVPFKVIDWKKEFEKRIFESKLAVDKFKSEIEATLNLEDATGQKKKEYLFEKYQECRQRFNRFEPKSYFEFYPKNEEDVTYRKFTAFAYFKPDPITELGLISDAIIIQRNAQFIHNKYVEVVNERVVDFADLNIFMNEIPNILSHMIYDRDLYGGLLSFHNDFGMEHGNYGLPVDMMALNYKDQLEDYLESVINKLEVFLKGAEQSNGILYLQTRLKQMRLRNLDYQKYSFTAQHHKIKTKYSERFKEYLEIEADFIGSTKDIRMPALKVLYNTEESFDTIFTAAKGEFILDLLEDLSITVNGISQLSIRRKGAIRGVVDALLENSVVPNLSIETLCKIIAQKIGLSLNSKLNFTDISEEYRKAATKYIQTNYVR